MIRGNVVSIYICPSKGQPLHSVNQVHAVPGRGLEGDRYFDKRGSFSDKPGEGRQVTLIEIEAIEAMNDELGISLSPSEARRNLVTRGVPLNQLVEKEFKVGEIILKGIRLCEPCDYLAKLTQPEVLPALVNRGGLRADILSEGIIHVGDVVKEV